MSKNNIESAPSASNGQNIKENGYNEKEKWHADRYKKVYGLVAGALSLLFMTGSVGAQVEKRTPPVKSGDKGQQAVGEKIEKRKEQNYSVSKEQLGEIATRVSLAFLKSINIRAEGAKYESQFDGSDLGDISSETLGLTNEDIATLSKVPKEQWDDLFAKGYRTAGDAYLWEGREMSQKMSAEPDILARLARILKNRDIGNISEDISEKLDSKNFYSYDGSRRIRCFLFNLGSTVKIEVGDSDDFKDLGRKEINRIPMGLHIYDLSDSYDSENITRAQKMAVYSVEVDGQKRVFFRHWNGKKSDSSNEEGNQTLKGNTIFEDPVDATLYYVGASDKADKSAENKKFALPLTFANIDGDKIGFIKDRYFSETAIIDKDGKNTTLDNDNMKGKFFDRYGKEINLSLVTTFPEGKKVYCMTKSVDGKNHIFVFDGEQVVELQ